MINIENMSFSYLNDLKPLFKNITLNIHSDWKLGLIGRNGYGKTSFLNILRGNLKYEGEINTNLEFEYFPYNIPKSDYQLMTIEVIRNLNIDFQLWQLEKELNILKLDPKILYRPFYTLSSGEQTKILIASLFLNENKFMLIDEPTNHLDTHGRKELADYLNTKNGFILISHDRDFLNNTIDHILSIEKSKIHITKGNYNIWEENKKLEDNFNLDKNKKLRTDIRRLKASAREKSQWSNKIESSKKGNGPVDTGYIGRKSADMMQLSKNIENRKNKAIKDKEGLLENIEEIPKLEINCLSHHDNTLFYARLLQILYDNKPIFKTIYFNLDIGDCLVLSGINGSGKSSILKLLIGDNIQYKGDLIRASNIKISYLPQTFSHLTGNLYDFIKYANIDQVQFLTILRKLGFSREQFNKTIDSYSLGQKKKLLIAKSLCEEAHLYIWDEPLNYIDLISRIQIENMIAEFSPTMIMVEHDKTFIDNIATDIIELEKIY